MHDINQLIQQHGNLIYLITFVWTALEGETFVIFAGLAAQEHALNAWFLFLAAWAGSFCGDQCFFFIGRRFGAHILHHFPKLEPPVNRALGWLERHAPAFILAYRFMYGIRNISGIGVGMSHIRWQKFAAWNALAAFIWAASFTGFGYVFGGVVAHMHHKTQVVEDSVRQIMLSMLGLFLLIVCFRLFIGWWQGRKRA